MLALARARSSLCAAAPRAWAHAAPVRRPAPAPRRWLATHVASAPPRPIEPAQWHLVDCAEGVSVGRLAARIAPVLRGKHKPQFEAHRHEHGDFVVVVNADKLVFTGKKWAQKLYRHHTGYPGGLKERTAKEMQRRKPGEVLRRAVLGMLPKNKLRQTFATRLKIYAGKDHPHGANIAGSGPRA